MISIDTLRDFNAVSKSLIHQARTFSVIEKGKKKTLHIGGHPEVIYQPFRKSKSKYFNQPGNINVIQVVHSQVTKHIRKKEFFIEEVKSRYPAINVKKDLYQPYPDGSYFYHIDIKHAYWRFAYSLGYISYATYKKYKGPQYKLARNIALATLATKKQKKFYENGEMILQVKCDDQPRWMIYKNIRYATHNICGEIEDLLGDRCISYRIDGLMVINEAETIMKVKAFLKKHNLQYIISERQKINDHQYVITDTGELKNL